MNAEELVVLARALSPAIESYGPRVTLEQRTADQMMADDQLRGLDQHTSALLLARRRAEALMADAEVVSPPTMAGHQLAEVPLFGEWCREVAVLATVSDPQLALAGLRAVRWVEHHEADLSRQRAACAALGVDFEARVAAFRSTWLPMLHQRARSVRGVDWLDRPLPEGEADRRRAWAESWAELDADARGELLDREVEVLNAEARSADLTRAVRAVTCAFRLGSPFDRREAHRGWLWPWDAALVGSSSLGVDPLPVVYPPDWDQGWTDHFGRGGDVVAGECLVLDAEEVQVVDIRPSAWRSSRRRPVRLPLAEVEGAEHHPVANVIPIVRGSEDAPGSVRFPDGTGMSL